MTDYMLRLSNSTLVIIKHWRPIPKLGEPSIFVVAIDDSPASMRALEQVRACPSPRSLLSAPPSPPYCCPYPCPYCTHTEPAELRYRPGRGHAPSPASDWISWRLVRAALPCAFARARARGFAFVVRLRVPRARASRDLWARRMTRARAGRPPSPSPSPY